MESNKRRVISLLVDNQSGVLARVSNLFWNGNCCC